MPQGKSAKEDNVSFDRKDETIRRLKILSLSQTAFLKDFIGKKLKHAKDLVNDALITLKNDGAAVDLINSLAELDIDSLTSVDVKSAQLMMHEELAMLRESIEKDASSGGVSTPATISTTPVGNDSAKSKALEKLEAENSELRALLEESKKQLVDSEKDQSDREAKETEVSALSDEISTLKADCKDKDLKLKDLQAGLETSMSAYATLEAKHKELRESQSSLEKGSAATLDEIKALKEEVSILTKKLEQTEKDLALSNEALKSQEKEAEEKAQKTASEHEAEKEEMMEAMAQELEETEEKHAEEIASLTKENKKLNKSLSKLKDSSQALSNGLLPVKNSMDSVCAAKESLSTTVKNELEVTMKEICSYFGSTLIKKLKMTEHRFADITVKWKKEMSERKRLHNVVQELKGNIRVFMRCRPPSSKEIEQFGGSESVCVSDLGEGEVKVLNEKGREKVWEFDQYFGVDSSQEEVYAEVSDLIVSVLDGFNVCIFAYGQTGSGKTYTMTGPSDAHGVNIRALADLFQKAEMRTADWIDTISVSVLEVYNEAINDLLVAGGGDKLEVKQGAKGNHVPNLTQVPVSSLEEVRKLLSVADKNRAQASTNMNEHSSRSHMMLTVSISSEHKETHVVSRGKLNLVDLAGSERLDKSGATGQALKEAQNINKSLSALGDVIAARAQKQGHIPFRNSTLTYLLQDSLSQDSKTLMIVCVSPVIYNAEETFCSLNFASRVRTVELGKASRNVSGPKGAQKKSAGR